LKRLRQAGGLQVDEDGDELVLRVMGSSPVRLRVENRARLSEAELESLLSRDRPSDQRRLLVTRELAPRRRERLIAHDVSWIEYGTGVVHLRAPGVAVDLPEDPSYARGRRGVSRLPSLEGKAGVIVEILIESTADNDLVEQPVVARLSEANQGWVSQIFSALVAAGALEEVGSGPNKRWRAHREELLDLWIQEGGPKPHVTPLYVWSRGSADLVRRLAGLDAPEVAYAVGGVVAADLYVPTLTERPDPAVWIPAAMPPEALARALDGEVVDSGANLWVWQVSGDPALQRARPLGSWAQRPGPLDRLRLVSPPRAVVEAAGGPGRASEVSERLRAEIGKRAAEFNG
jgi:hypothetical protein